MKLLFFICLLPLAVVSHAQVQLPHVLDTSAASIAYWEGWMQDLQTRGARQQADSFIVEPEVVRLMKDETYRNTMYPATYSWQTTVALLEKMELKKAFWHLQNLYASDKKNRGLVLQSLCAYDSLFAIDKMLMNSFYTYAFTDPRVYRNNKGKAEIVRPDLLEQHLAVAKEICEHIWAYRRQKTPAQAQHPIKK